MFNEFYDVDSEPIVNLEAFYGPKKHLVDKCDLFINRFKVPKRTGMFVEE